MRTWDRVDLPEPLGPMTACTSPEPHHQVDAVQDLTTGDLGREAFDAQLSSCQSTTTNTSSSSILIRYTGVALVAGSVDGSPVSREKQLPCFQHSSSRDFGVDLALGQRDVGVGAAVADGVEVVAEAHHGDTGLAQSKRWAVAVGDVADGTEPLERHRACLRSRRPSMAASITGTTPGTGKVSSTSSKKPATISRSATSVGTPRLSR